MFSEIFNPFLLPFIGIFALSAIMIVLVVATYKTLVNLINGNKDKIWNDIKWTSKVFGSACFVAVLLFWVIAANFIM